MADKEKKGKKKHVNKPTSEKYTHYAKGSPRFCPKCGPGIILASHKDRVACGTCGYTEFAKR